MTLLQRLFRKVARYSRIPHRRYVFRRVMREVLEQRDDLEFLIRSIPDIVYGWGNEYFSASPEYAEACVRQARESDGSILECGSGLTTLLLGLVGDQTGQSIFSLEHHEHWATRVGKTLDMSGISSAHLCSVQLREYGEFVWYDPPQQVTKEKFSLVVCDGPPGTTPGGRYGLLPVMRPHLKPGCVILLDDLMRGQEKTITSRWMDEYSATVEICGAARPYARIVLPE